MGAQVIFILGFLILMAGLMCVKKMPEKVSFFRSLVICYITELCFGAVLAGIYSVVKIPVGLISMGCGYLVLALLVWGWIIYKREMQKFAIYAVDVYSFLVLTLFFGLLFIKVFTPEIAIVYKNSDPGTHFLMALKVLENKKVSNMYFAPLYNGLVLELFQPFLAKISLYKAFILADSVSNYVNLLIFYVILSTIIKSRFWKVMSPWVCILYFLGWPFYSYVAGGYVYFGVGITLFVYVIYLLIILRTQTEMPKRCVILGLILLGIFSVSICYMLFTPFLCVAVVLCLRHIMKKENIVIPKKVGLTIGIGTLVVAGVIFCICFFGFFKGDITQIFSSLRIEGGIHRELYKDFLFMLPPVIYMGWHYYRKKETDFIFLTTVVITGITAFAFLVCIFGGMSGYYYYKLYYMLWLFFWLVCIQAGEHFIKENKILLCAYGLPILAAIVMMFSGGDAYLATRDLANENSPSLFPIYEVTKQYINESYETREMESLISVSQYINENFNEEKGIPLISSVDKFNYGVWYRDFTGYKQYWADRSNDSESEKYLGRVLEQLGEDGYSYFVIIKTADCYIENEEVMSVYEAVYDDGYMGLYKMK